MELALILFVGFLLVRHRRRKYLRPSQRTTVLYRLYGSHRELLYVGISNNPELRFKQHKATKSWWGQVHDFTLTPYPDRFTASRAELQAIKTEYPVFNIAGKHK